MGFDIKKWFWLFNSCLFRPYVEGTGLILQSHTGASPYYEQTNLCSCGLLSCCHFSSEQGIRFSLHRISSACVGSVCGLNTRLKLLDASEPCMRPLASSCHQPSGHEKQAIPCKTWMIGTKLPKQKQDFASFPCFSYYSPLVAESSHGHPTNTPMAFSLAENHEKFPQASKANSLIRFLSCRWNLKLCKYKLVLSFDGPCPLTKTQHTKRSKSKELQGRLYRCIGI